MRLNQFLAAAGWGSRRSAEQLIRAGRVKVNDLPAALSSRVQSDRDRVTVDGKAVHLPESHTYLLLHKPAGYTVTRADVHATRNVYALLPRHFQKLAHVGRLDRESEGLLLFTDDGRLGNRLLRPESGLRREYLVDTPDVVSRRDLARLRAGIELEPGVVGRVLEAGYSRRVRGGGTLRVVLAEGKKREVRRLCRALRVRVARLRRTRFGPLALGRLPAGAIRELRPAEIAALRKSVGGQKEVPIRRPSS